MSYEEQKEYIKERLKNKTKAIQVAKPAFNTHENPNSDY